MDLGGESSMLMSDIEILESITKGDLGIDGFEKGRLSGTSYDVAVGDEGVCGSEKRKHKFRDEGPIAIPPGDLALILSLERFRLPLSIAGHSGLATDFARKGLIGLSGLQLDPGFEGKMIMGVFNSSPNNVAISYGDPLMRVEFYRLRRSATKSYTGRHQGQTEISAEDINLISGPFIKVREEFKTWESLQSSLRSLTEVLQALLKRLERS